MTCPKQPTCVEQRIRDTAQPASPSRRHRAAAWLGTALLLAGTDAVAGYGAYFLGPGVKAVGMGGLSYAHAEESYVYSSNPALGASLDNRLDFGIDLELVVPEARIDGNLLGPDQTSASRYKVAPIPQFGFSRRVNPVWTYGASAFFSGVATDYKDSPYRQFGGDERVTIALPQAGISLGTSWEPIRGQALGIAVNLGYTEVSIKGVDVFAPLSADPERLSNQGKQGQPNIGLTVGWYGKLTDTLAAGISYRSKAYSKRFDEYAGLLPDRGRLEFPAQYGLGLTWMPHPSTSLGIEYQRIEYAHERAFGNPIQNLIDGNALGSRNGPGFGWRSVDITKLGAAWQPRPWITLRAGYARSRRPNLPPSETLFGILAPSFAQTHYTAGVTLAMGPKYELSLTGSKVAEDSVQGQDSIPLLIRTGPLGLVPLPIGGGEANLKNDQSQISVSIGRRF